MTGLNLQCLNKDERENPHLLHFRSFIRITICLFYYVIINHIYTVFSFLMQNVQCFRNNGHLLLLFQMLTFLSALTFSVFITNKYTFSKTHALRFGLLSLCSNFAIVSILFALSHLSTHLEGLNFLVFLFSQLCVVITNNLVFITNYHMLFDFDNTNSPHQSDTHQFFMWEQLVALYAALLCSQFTSTFSLASTAFYVTFVFFIHCLLFIHANFNENHNVNHEFSRVEIDVELDELQQPRQLPNEVLVNTTEALKRVGHQLSLYLILMIFTLLLKIFKTRSIELGDKFYYQRYLVYTCSLSFTLFVHTFDFCSTFVELVALAYFSIHNFEQHTGDSIHIAMVYALWSITKLYVHIETFKIKKDAIVSKLKQYTLLSFLTSTCLLLH